MASPTVVLVPGDPLTGRVTENGIQSYGYDVLVARTRADALDRLRTNRRIRVLVVDADGANVLTLAKVARSVNPELQVIYASRASNMPPEREKVGGAPCLRAPYHPHQLVGVIGGLLRRQSSDGREIDAALANRIP